MRSVRSCATGRVGHAILGIGGGNLAALLRSLLLGPEATGVPPIAGVAVPGLEDKGSAMSRAKRFHGGVSGR